MKPFSEKTLVVVGGPTASGKTGLAIRLAKHYQTVVVSADSRQLFREMTIGTAKPSAEELEEIPHYFINSHSVTQVMNASLYGEEARTLLHQLFKEKDVVIMAGGSGLYIDAVIHGFDNLPAASPEIRQHLEELLKREGIAALQSLLREKDPATAAQTDMNNQRRLIRALEVIMTTGKPVSSLRGKEKEDLPFRVMMVGIDHPRKELYERIDLRTREMIANGLCDEVASLLPYRHLPALQTVGYREMFDHLDGKISLKETETLIAQHTRNYAKRQLTWFRKYTEMVWLKPDQMDFPR